MVDGQYYGSGGIQFSFLRISPLKRERKFDLCLRCTKRLHGGAYREIEKHSKKKDLLQPLARGTPSH